MDEEDAILELKKLSGCSEEYANGESLEILLSMLEEYGYWRVVEAYRSLQDSFS